VTSRLSDELRSRITARLSDESSDTKLASEFGVSRKTIWRLRNPQVKPRPRPKSEEIPPPPTDVAMTVVVPPNPPVPRVSNNHELREPPPPVTKPARRRTRSDVIPKVDPVKVHLSTYFAVQLLRCEKAIDVLRLVLEDADKKGILFRKIQVLDITSVGGTSFVRFRSDVSDAHTIVKDFPDRAIITQSLEGYRAWFPSGKTGKFPASSMCVGPKMGYGQTYVGTRVKRWKQQFAA